MCMNRTYDWNVMTVWISLEPLFFYFERLDISCASIAHHVKSYGRLNWTRASGFNYERLYILCAWIGHPSEMLWPFEFLDNYHFSISSVSIYHGPQSYAHVKSYGRLNWIRASVFNFERLDILCAWFGHPSEMLWAFQLLDNYEFSILSVSIYHVPQS